MIRPADWRLVEWAAEPAHATDAARFIVRRGPNAWHVERDGAVHGSFRAPDQAVAHACRLARHQAVRGALGVVMAETQPYELHCFMPTLHLGEEEAARLT